MSKVKLKTMEQLKKEGWKATSRMVINGNLDNCTMSLSSWCALKLLGRYVTIIDVIGGYRKEPEFKVIGPDGYETQIPWVLTLD